MNLFLQTLGNPLWQVFTVVIALAAPLFIVVVRTRDVHASVQQKRRDTLRVLLVCLAAFLLMSGLVSLLPLLPLLPLQNASPTRTSSNASAPALTPSSTPTPSPSPTPMPTPTPTPRLAHSITQVLMTFCNALNSKEYQTAWNQYASSLQKAHPEPATIVAWRRFTHCSLPDQSGDPTAWTVLTLTLGPGYTDRFGRSGDTDYRFTLSVEGSAWKMTRVCEIMSEGCFAVSWG